MHNKLSRKNLFWMMLVVGLLIALQYKVVSSGTKYIPLQQMQQAKLTLNKENQELQQLREQVQQKKLQLDRIENGSDVEQELAKHLKSEIQDLKTYNGMTEVEGTGIIILLTDATRELFIGEPANNLMVHDWQIQGILDDLRYAGAEAISVNDQRVINFVSPIYCNGPTIRINDQLVSQPFIIKAIGNQDALIAAINAPGKKGSQLRDLGIFIEVDTSVNVRVPAYSGDIQFKHLQPDKGGA